MTTPVHALAGQSIGATPTPSPRNDLDRDAFLKLLVAQLRYQNPMSPADPQSFLAQTAQFTSVERLEQVASLLASSERLQQLATGASLVGREVIYARSEGVLARGVVTAARPTVDGTVLVVDDGELPLPGVLAVL